MKLGLASPDLGSFLSPRHAAHGRRDGRVHGHEAGGARVREARHVERAPAVEAVPLPIHRRRLHRRYPTVPQKIK